MNFEITFDCQDDDWLSWHMQATDFHEACMLAFTRLHMAGTQPEHKLHNARLLRVEETKLR